MTISNLECRVDEINFTKKAKKKKVNIQDSLQKCSSFAKLIRKRMLWAETG